MKVNLDNIKRIREQTGVGVMDARRALAESGGDMKKAKLWLSDHAVQKAAKKAQRQTSQGAIFGYVHQTGKVAAMVKLGCETDFVAKTDDFKTLGKEIVMQIASMNPANVDVLVNQEWIRDPQKTIKQLIEANIAKMGENIKVLEIGRMEV
jgi:elongation factor Ts